MQAGVLGCRSFSTTRSRMVNDEPLTPNTNDQPSASNTNDQPSASNTNDQPSTSNTNDLSSVPDYDYQGCLLTDEEKTYRVERNNTAVSELDESQVPDAYHETKQDLANAITDEERNRLTRRLDSLDRRIDEEELEDTFDGYPPRYDDESEDVRRRMNTEPENLDPGDYVAAATEIEEQLNVERNPIVRAQLQERVARIYEEAERCDLTGEWGPDGWNPN